MFNPKLSGEKVLWTNPNPSSAFSSQTITLNSKDYDLLEIIFNNQGKYKSVRVLKGENILLDGFYSASASESYYSYRYITYSNDENLNVDNCNLIKIQGTSSAFGNNVHCIPIKIIGYKTGLF